MRALPVLVGLLALGLTGCTAEVPAAPRTETLAVTFSNQPEREFGDLLDETLTITYALDAGNGYTTTEIQLAPGETVAVEFGIAEFDEVVLESRARSASGTSSGSSVTIRQSDCGHLEVVHLDIRYYAKLTAGAWSWGGEIHNDCPSAS